MYRNIRIKASSRISSQLIAIVLTTIGYHACQTSSAPSFSVYFIILVSHPLGHLMARYLPQRKIMGVQLNPGEFNVKVRVFMSIRFSGLKRN